MPDKRIANIPMFALLLLVGCNSPGMSPERQLMEHRSSLIRQGMTANYADGYIDGCSTGKHQAGIQGYLDEKDRDRFKYDEEYAVAFEHGYEACFEQDRDTEGQKRIWEDMKK